MWPGFGSYRLVYWINANNGFIIWNHAFTKQSDDIDNSAKPQITLNHSIFIFLRQQPGIGESSMLLLNIWVGAEENRSQSFLKTLLLCYFQKHCLAKGPVKHQLARFVCGKPVRDHCPCCSTIAKIPTSWSGLLNRTRSDSMNICSRYILVKEAESESLCTWLSTKGDKIANKNMSAWKHSQAYWISDPA